RRKEALRLPARADVAQRARGRDGVGRAPLLLATVDRPPARGLTGRALVESPAKRRLHARQSLQRGSLVGFRGAPGHGIGTGLSMTTSTSEGPLRSSAFFKMGARSSGLSTRKPGTPIDSAIRSKRSSGSVRSMAVKPRPRAALPRYSTMLSLRIR